MKRTVPLLLAASLGFMALAAGAGAGAGAGAKPMPGLRGVNPVGMTVPDMAQAEGLFVDVPGCQTAMAFGPFRDDKGTFMQDVLAVDPRAVFEPITMLRCGFGSNIELFKDTAPDQTAVKQRNSDIGGHHIALYVEDIDAAAAYLKTTGSKTLHGPWPVNDGVAAGQSILYFCAPWGLHLEAIAFPKAMACDKDGGPVLGSNTDPAT